MKSIHDFKVVDGIACLEGISYVEEARVIETFLKQNSSIKYVTLVSKDKRFFKIDNGRLILSQDQITNNPYYLNQEIDVSKASNLEGFESNGMKDHDFHRIVLLERKIKFLESCFFKLLEQLQEYLKQVEVWNEHE